MKTKDIQILNQMRHAVAVFLVESRDPGSLANSLVILRDLLECDDDKWLNELTQNIVTLDSASSFAPANDEQNRQLKAAIATAGSCLRELIDEKIRVLTVAAKI